MVKLCVLKNLVSNRIELKNGKNWRLRSLPEIARGILCFHALVMRLMKDLLISIHMQSSINKLRKHRSLTIPRSQSNIHVATSFGPTCTWNRTSAAIKWLLSYSPGLLLYKCSTWISLTFSSFLVNTYWTPSVEKWVINSPGP